MQVLEPLHVLVEGASNVPIAPLPHTALPEVCRAHAAAFSLLLAAAFEVGGGVLADVAMLARHRGGGTVLGRHQRRVVVSAAVGLGLAEVGGGVDGRLPREVEALRQRRREGIVVAEEAEVVVVEETQVDVVAGGGHGRRRAERQ